MLKQRLLKNGYDITILEIPMQPEAPLLLLPLPNETCMGGTSFNSTQSTVNFSWHKSKSTDSYELIIKNLISGAEENHSITDTTAVVNLEKGIPYSWYIIAKTKNSSITAKSSVFKFYNAGEGPTYYAPFPAEVVKPVANAVLTTTKKTLKWKSSDVDNDISGYDVYLGTAGSEKLLAPNLKSDSLEVSLAGNTSYYWKVICKDARGNSSISESFKFSTN